MFKSLIALLMKFYEITYPKRAVNVSTENTRKLPTLCGLHYKEYE